MLTLDLLVVPAEGPHGLLRGIPLQKTGDGPVEPFEEGDPSRPVLPLD